MVLDGTGAPVRDAVIEAWQADAAGIYPHPEDPRHAEVAPGFRGWGRACTDFETGIWTFETVKPGPVPGPDGALQAPHVTLWIVARGINLGLATRLYFSDEGEANRDDPVLGLIDQTHRRDTLMARREDRDGAVVYRFDIHLQGEHETVFLEI
jgi:protocatechuate 3,4-dioxygenase alpha subunit